MSRIIVKNLPSTITEKKLREIFETKGFITDLQLKYNKAGVFRKFAFVGYKTEEEAKAAKEYFHNTFVFTSKVQVEFCCNLYDPSKPKSWKEFLKEKADKAKLIEAQKESPEVVTKEVTKEKKKKSKSEKTDVPNELKNDPKFKEFLAVHEDRKSKPLWADDIAEIEDEEQSESNGEDDDGYSVSLKDSFEQEGKSATDEEKNKIKCKGNEETNETEKKAEQKMSEKKAKIHDFIYTVKLKNLPYSCKKKQIKEFLQPLKLVSLRIPQKNKGFAFVSFKTEKDLNKALIKHRGYLGGHRIDVIKYIKKETFETDKKSSQNQDHNEVDLELLSETGRIYARNLCFSVKEAELQELFSKYGPLAEVYLPMDRLTKKAQGFAFITYLFAEHALKAYTELDGTIFQGRVLHLTPAQPKKENHLENETNYKKQKEAKLKALSGSSHNWNILFMSMNAVADHIAEKYNVEKSTLLSGNTKESVAVRMALSETQVVTDTRKFLLENGVQLDAFSQPAAKRSDTIIIVKHLPAKTTEEELKEVFSKHGVINRVILPPSGMIAIIEFQDSSEAKNAFKKLAYSRFHHLPLYLEWAPTDSLKDPPPKTEDTAETSIEKQNPEEQEQLEIKEDDPPPGTTVFVKSINFNTKQEDFRKHFEKCGPVHSAIISTKKDIKTGKTLSMGFGFVQYKSKESAMKAVRDLQLSKLDDHMLEIKFSNRATIPTATTARKKHEIKEQLSSKILVKNVAFEATEKEIRELFSGFGDLKSVRLPKKMGNKDEHRGFAFVEYNLKHAAKRAFEALCHSTHLFGRRLILEWANPDSEDVGEIRKKTAREFVESGPKKKFKKSKFSEDAEFAFVRTAPDDGE